MERVNGTCPGPPDRQVQGGADNMRRHSGGRELRAKPWRGEGQPALLLCGLLVKRLPVGT